VLLPIGLLVGAFPLLVFFLLMKLASDLYCTDRLLSEFLLKDAVPLGTILAIVGAPLLAGIAALKKAFLLGVGIAITYVPIFIITFGFTGLLMGWAMGGASLGLLPCHPS
jgi:hypothetical protein